MSTNIGKFKKSSSVPPMETGTYAAVCTGVIDLGLQETQWEGKIVERPQLLIIWEFPDELIEIEGEQKRRWISQPYTASVHERSRLRKDLKTWRGQDFTEEQLKDFDIANVIGAPCMVTVTHTPKDGVIYANVGGVSKAIKGLQVAPPIKKLHFDMDNQDTWGVFAELPEWIQTKINASLTLKEQGITIAKDGTILNNMPKRTFPQSDEPFIEIDDDNDDLPF